MYIVLLLLYVYCIVPVYGIMETSKYIYCMCNIWIPPVLVYLSNIWIPPVLVYMSNIWIPP